MASYLALDIYVVLPKQVVCDWYGNCLVTWL